MKIIFICTLLSVIVNCYSMQIDWGKWYGDKAKQDVNSIDFDGKQVRIVKTGTSSRNLLLTDEGKIYINNMYPINSENYLQLVDVLREKQLIDESHINLLETNPQWGDDPSPHIDAFLAFVSAVITYLQAFDQIDDAIASMRKAQQLFKKKDYQTLNAIKRYLQNGNEMAPVWKFMHTEFLYIFHDYYSIESGSWGKGYLSRKVISHYDMCEDCEYLMLRLLSSGKLGGTDTYMGDKGECNYTILFASFYPYYQSRQRDGNSPLLKVVLKDN